MTVGVAGLLVAVHLIAQGPAQTSIRDVDGHGENARQALRAAEQVSVRAVKAAETTGVVATTGAAIPRRVPVVVSPRQGALVMSVVAPGSPVAGALFTIDEASDEVWPAERPDSAVAAELGEDRTVLWLYREPGGALVAGPVVHVPALQQVTGQVPDSLQRLGFRIQAARQVAPGWILATLTRT